MNDRKPSAGVSAYLRQNAIALVALFFAVSGAAAWATHPGGANTIGSTDIINGDIRTADLRARSVNRDKIAPGAVSSAEVVDDNLRSEDILDGEIRAVDVAFGTLRGDEILDGTIGGNDLVDDGVTGQQVQESSLFNDNSLTTADLADASVGKGELAPNAVGASELVELVTREDPAPPTVAGGAAHNGAYNFEDSVVSCNAGEELITAHAQWRAVQGAFDPADELFVRSVILNHSTEQAIVSGGNDSGDDYRLVAVATCLQP